MCGGTFAPNHTYTHVLNHGLRKVLGHGVEQRGSEVDAKKLRFDFSHKKAVTPQQVKDIEDYAQSFLTESKAVYSQVIPLDHAKRVHGLRAVFGETYPDPVRVVSIGVSVSDLLEDPENLAWEATSIELCGGTHLSETKEAEAFAIIEETSTSTGVRRMVAFTKDAAKEARETGKRLLKEIASAESVPNANLPDLLPDLTASINTAVVPYTMKAELQKRLSKLSKKSLEALKLKAKALYSESLEAARGEVLKHKESKKNFVVLLVPLLGDTKLISKLVSCLLDETPELAVLAMSLGNDKKSLRCCAGTNMDSVQVNKWVSATMGTIGGKGGGKPKSANGSGSVSNESELSTVIAFAREWTN